ncbi:MAG: TadE/TadG family type IV pilus assembly protein [Kiritimatiellia bacterium]
MARIQRRCGQSLIESCVVMGILCLLLMGLFQLSQLYMAQEIMHYAAGRGARARAVGFNDFMVHKSVRVATIAAAGPMESSMRSDLPTGGPLAQRGIERARIPLYMGADHYGLLRPILDYEDWDTISHSLLEQDDPARVDCRVRQDFPVSTVVFKAFYGDDSVPLRGSAAMDSHYPLYLYLP